jgi:pimeloyl-ACP methyl ester carboxylesterase
MFNLLPPSLSTEGNFMRTVTSKDGTTIAYDQSGAGPAVILVDGALGCRTHWGQGPLAARLADHFTLYTYDRRGRGDSTDTQPYAAEREIEDIEALIEEAGGSAYLYGLSSGAVLALKAAAELGSAKVQKLALYEPPFGSDDDTAKQEFAQYTGQMDELLGAGRRGDAVAFFMADMMPPEMLEEMRQSPDWPILESLAPTLAYDNAIMGDGSLRIDDAKAVTMPTLVLVGSESPAFKHEAADALTTILPHAEQKTLEGEGRTFAPEAPAPALIEFFASSVVVE